MNMFFGTVLRVKIFVEGRGVQVMVQVMGIFSVLIEETIMRLQVMVQAMVMDLFSVLIKGASMRLQGLQSSHQGYRV